MPFGLGNWRPRRINVVAMALDEDKHTVSQDGPGVQIVSRPSDFFGPKCRYFN